MSDDAPESTPLVARVVSQLRLLSTDIDAMDQATADYFGVNRTDARCMDILSLGQSMTAGQLARAVGVSAAATTTVIDRLEKAGHIRRLADPHDRRRVLVQVAPNALRRGQKLFEGLIGAGGRMLESYSEEQLALISDFLERCRALVNQHTRAIRAKPRRRAERPAKHEARRNPRGA